MFRVTSADHLAFVPKRAIVILNITWKGTQNDSNIIG